MLKCIQKYFKNRKQKDLNAKQNLAQGIGYFYFEQNRGDCSKANNDTFRLGITDLKIKGRNITIRLTRPGLLIGARGTNIEQLKHFLSHYYKKAMKINIVEDTIIPCLAVYNPEDLFEDIIC